MSRNYKQPSVEISWYRSRKTHPAVATAIHAIYSGWRTPERIWEDPAGSEIDNVHMAVAEYLAYDDFERSEDGMYAWGEEKIEIPHWSTLAVTTKQKECKS